MYKKKPTFNIIYLNEIDSTNNFLKNLSKETDAKEGTVILADFQTGGRGQGSNNWYGKRGLNIAMSVLFNPKIHVAEHFFLSEFISLAIIDTLNSYNIRAKIKWPNDIYVQNKKIAGILIENHIQKDSINQTIAGIGLNVNEITFPEELPNPVSMKMILKHKLNRQIIVNNLIRNILMRYHQLKEGDFDSLHRDYYKKLYRRNILTEFKAGEISFKARIEEVSKTGELVLIDQQLEKKSYLFGEVQMVV
jgi:BirA family transcriptional regulator, biotin operon repressor / biotin---[acetyl-CoA-carboxylase] ligase